MSLVLSTMSFSLVSCGDDDEPSEENNKTEGTNNKEYGDPAYGTKYDSDPEYCGSITVYDETGKISYSRDVSSAGYYFYKKDIEDEYANLVIRAYFKSEGSPQDGMDYIYKNKNTLAEIFLRDQLQRITLGDISNYGDANLVTFIKEGTGYLIYNIPGKFNNGEVSVVYIKSNKYIVVKFNNCKIEVSGSDCGYFNGEIKFELKPYSFFFS